MEANAEDIKTITYTREMVEEIVKEVCEGRSGLVDYYLSLV